MAHRKMEDNQRFMTYALVLAKKAFDSDEVPIGAVIVKNDQVIGRGFNQVESLNNPTAHAEIIAIREATHNQENRRLNECTIYVTKEPCPMCAGAIVLARIDRLVFAVPDEKNGYAGTLHNTLQDEDLNHQVEIETGVLSGEASALLKQFFSELRE